MVGHSAPLIGPHSPTPASAAMNRTDSSQISPISSRQEPKHEGARVPLFHPAYPKHLQFVAVAMTTYLRKVPARLCSYEPFCDTTCWVIVLFFFPPADWRNTNGSFTNRASEPKSRPAYPCHCNQSISFMIKSILTWPPPPCYCLPFRPSNNAPHPRNNVN